MKKVTKDGSITFYNEEYGEHYHTTSGAEEEALEKFARPLQPYLEKKREVVILDFCFGLGYNTAAFIDLYHDKFARLTFYCFENDPKIIRKMGDVHSGMKSFPQLRDNVQELLVGEKKSVQFTYMDTPIVIHLMMGDAKVRIKDIGMVDAVLFDPFSPKKHPEMWTRETLESIRNKMNPGAALTTYSCARTFRDTLRELGFEVVNGPCIGRKAPSTIAVKKDL